MTFITQVLNGLQLGSIYALVALGYTMVYGIILLLNFAHGDIIMAGAYISWFVMSKLGLNPAIAVVLSIVGCMLLGVLIDKVAYAPLRDAPRLSILITAIGVVLPREWLPAALWSGRKGGAGLHQREQHPGRGPHAVLLGNRDSRGHGGCHGGPDLPGAEDQARKGHARRVRGHGRRAPHGHQRQHHHLVHVCVGSALAGIGAVLYCMAYTQASPTMGIMLGTKAFVAAVLGGIGSILGAVIGGLLVGFAEVFVSAIGLSVWQDAVVFLLLIVVLIVKSTGLLGRPMTEEV